MFFYRPKNCIVYNSRVECVDSDMIENYNVADRDDAESKPFDSVALKGLVEKPPLE